MSSERHISSLVVLHRNDAMPALEALIDACANIDIAARADCRCVVLCETDDQRTLLDHIDEMQALPGVMNVSLVCHHVESVAELEGPL